MARHFLSSATADVGAEAETSATIITQGIATLGIRSNEKEISHGTVSWQTLELQSFNREPLASSIG